MGAGGIKRPGGAQPQPLGRSSILPMAMQQRIAANKPFSQQYDPTTQQYNDPQQAQNPIQQNIKLQPQGGKGGMPGAQQYGQKPFDNVFSSMQQYDPTTQQYRQSQSPIAPQGNPMQGGKGGMPGAQQYTYNPATQQFSQQQGLAGMLGPQQSSLNSLQ